MIWRTLRTAWAGRRAAGSPADSKQYALWWQEAEQAAGAISEESIARLHETAAVPVEDEAELREEMLAGLGRLLAVTQELALPTVPTQHRVIGADTCHLVVPASRVDLPDGAGKLFLTSRRAIFAGGTVISCPWHRVTEVVRLGRDLMLVSPGGVVLLRARCNDFGDALVAAHVATRLRRSP